MSSCPPAQAAYTNSELTTRYSGGTMEATSPSDANRTSEGLLKPEYLASRIESLKAGNNPLIPAAPTIPTPQQPNIDANVAIQAYVSKTDNLKSVLKSEYCHYLGRYQFAIRKMVESIGSATTQGTGVGTGNSGPSVAITVRTYTDAAKVINTALLDLSQLANAITEDQYTQAKQFNSRINDLNGEINNYFAVLKGHAAILKKEVPAVEIRKRMVEYTKEKSNAHRNLLGFYFFLDIVALGILFYVYKAT